MKQLVVSLMVFLIALNFNGCTIHEGATFGEKVVNNDGKEFAFKLNSVAILDKSIQKWEYLNNSTQHTTKSKIAVENIGITSLPTKNSEVFTTLRNRTDYPLVLSIRSQFYDNNKITLEEATSWQKVFLDKNTIITYKAKSISLNVENFLIEVRESE